MSIMRFVIAAWIASLFVAGCAHAQAPAQAPPPPASAPAANSADDDPILDALDAQKFH
jgi:hypothetical protein